MTPPVDVTYSRLPFALVFRNTLGWPGVPVVVSNHKTPELARRRARLTASSQSGARPAWPLSHFGLWSRYAPELGITWLED